MINAITPCIWMDGTAEEAANFYVSLFPDSRIDSLSYFPDDAQFPVGVVPGTVMVVTFTLNGQPFTALNGGPLFPQTEAISFMIPVDDQAQLDRYWDALTANGGSESMCGWCKDRFGVSWQVVPRRLYDMQLSGDAHVLARMNKALWSMHRLDIAKLVAAFEGASA